MVIEKRARKPEQKRERRTEILSAAITLLRERPYNKINIADVARRAGMAKGTVFLYFRTREELFLSIASCEFDQWFQAMDRSFAEIAGTSEKAARDRVLNALQQYAQTRRALDQPDPHRAHGSGAKYRLRSGEGLQADALEGAPAHRRPV